MDSLPHIKIAQVLDQMDKVDHEGEGIPFDLEYVSKDGRVIKYLQARLARNVRKELPLQLRRKATREVKTTDRREFNDRMAPDSSNKRLYISELTPPFRNCWFRSITQFNGREVDH